MFLRSKINPIKIKLFLILGTFFIFINLIFLELVLKMVKLVLL